MQSRQFPWTSPPGVAAMNRRQFLTLGTLASSAVLLTSCAGPFPGPTVPTGRSSSGHGGGIEPVPGASVFPRILQASTTQVVSDSPLGLSTWDATTGKLLGSISTAAHALSNDHRLLARPGDRGEIAVIDATTGAPVHALAGHPTGQVMDAPSNITCLAFSPDGSTLISAASDDPVVKVWRLSDGALATTLTIPTGTVTNASFSADGTRLAVAGYSLPTQIWDLPADRLLSSTPVGAANGSSVVLSPDGTRGAQIMRSNPTAVVLFAADTFRTVATAPTGTTATSATFSADGEVLAYSLYTKHQLALWHLKSTKVVIIDTEKAARPVFGPRSDVVYSATEYGADQALQLCSWNRDSGALQRRFDIAK